MRKQISKRDIVVQKQGGPVTYFVEECELFQNYRTFVYDDADPFMFIDGKGYSDEVIAEFIEVHKRARAVGEDIGRMAFRRELLDKLGAQPRGE